MILALWVAKATRTAMRILGKKATYLPGVIALRICPGFLTQIKKPGKVIAVTGTNGKTTVANLIGSALRRHGYKVLDNRLGSNTASGIACALLAGATLTGKTKHDAAVLETDERSSAHIFPFLRPNLLIITNLFRDSIMRNAHPEYIAGIISANVPGDLKLLLNADDLISCGVAPGNPRAYFGLKRMETDVTACENLINDFQVCPHCRSLLEYQYRRYHHIGRAKCPGCDFKSPDYDYSGEPDIRNKTIKVAERNCAGGGSCGESEYRLSNDSIFNIYNTLTAVAALRELGLTPYETVAAMADADIPDSRYNETVADGMRVVMQMAKDRNALACSRAFEYVVSKPGRKQLILMMNNISDSKAWSENTCWLYDCDFEMLAREEITGIVATGPRALDYCLRLRFAGISEEKLRYTDREIDSPDKLIPEDGGSVYIFYGTDSIDLAFKVRDRVLHVVKKAREGRRRHEN